MARQIHRVRSDKDTHFTTSLAQDALDIEDLGTVQNPSKVIRVTVWSDQNLAWDVVLFRTSSGQPATDADLDTMTDWVSFAAGDGVRFNSTGLYRYSVSGLDLRYAGDNNTLYLGLVNRSATSKNAGATGEVVIELEFESVP